MENDKLILSDEDKRSILGDVEAERQKVRDFKLQRNSILETDAPDDVAYDLKKSQELGVPRIAIAGDRDRFRREDEVSKQRAYRESAPRFSEWLDDPDNYAVARDDTESMGVVEQALRGTPKLAKAAASNFVSFFRSSPDRVKQQYYSLESDRNERDQDFRGILSAPFYGAAAKGRPALIDRLKKEYPIDEVEPLRVSAVGYEEPTENRLARYEAFITGEADQVEARFKEMNGGKLSPESVKALESQSGLVRTNARLGLENMRLARETPESDGRVQDWMISAGTSIGRMIPAIVVGAITKNPSASAAVIGGDVYTQSYDHGLRSGLSSSDAAEYAFGNAAIELVTERFALGSLFNKSGSDGMLKRFLKYQGKEQIGEQFATFGQDLTDIAYIDTDKTLEQFIAERPRRAIDTAMTTLIASSAIGGTFLAAERGLKELDKRAQQAHMTDGEKRVNKVMDAADKSALRARSPEKFQDALERIADKTDAETMVVDLDGLAEALGQSDVDLREAAAEFGATPEELQQAFDMGGEFNVKTAALLNSKLARENREALQDNVRLESDPLTPAQRRKEVEAINTEMDAELNRMGEDIKDAVTREDMELQVRELIAEQIGGTDVYSDGVVEVQARAMEAMVSTLATRLGITPVEAFQQLAPRLRGVVAGEVREAEIDPAALEQAFRLFRARKPDVNPVSDFDVNDVFETANGNTIELGFFDMNGKGEVALDWNVNGTPGSARPEGMPIQSVAEVKEIVAGVQDRLAKYVSAKRPKRLVLKPNSDAAERVYRRALKGADLQGYSLKERGDKDRGYTFILNAPTTKLDQSAKRAPRGAFDPVRNEITLFEGANLSTLMHESAHWYFDTLLRLEADGNAPAFVTKQMDEIFKWGGVDRGAEIYDENGRPTEQGRELHEKFAETFEAYLQDGKAPSAKLRDVFRAFKAWLTQLYRKLDPRTRASLTPEIREVFDRMMAVDDQITAATKQFEQTAEQMAQSLLDRGIITERQFKNAKKRLTDAREKAKEELMARLMDDVTRTEKQWWNSELSRVKGEVIREFDRSPVGRAMAWLGEGVYKGDVAEDKVPTGEALMYQAREAGYEGESRGEAVEWLRAKAKGLDMSTEARMARAKEMGFDTETKLYHGTGNLEGFADGFDPSITGQGNDQYGSGFYLTTAPWEASGYSEATLSNMPKLGGDTSPGVLPVFSRMKNPIRLTLETARNLDDAEIELSPEQVKRMLLSNPDTMDVDNSPLGDWHNIWDDGIQNWMIDDLANQYAGQPLSHIEGDLFRGRSGLFREQLSKETGHDGVIMDLSTEDYGEKIHHIVWSPSNIRSVNAAFDPDFSDSANLLAQDYAMFSGQRQDRYREEAEANAREKELQRQLDEQEISAGEYEEQMRSAGWLMQDYEQGVPAFYSALERFVEGVKQPKAPADQWKSMIAKAPGIKAEEVEWTGVSDWLDAQEGSVTREALAEYLSGNGVQIEEVVKSGDNQSDREAEIEREILPLIEERDAIDREFAGDNIFGLARAQDSEVYLYGEDKSGYQIMDRNDAITDENDPTDLELAEEVLEQVETAIRRVQVISGRIDELRDEQDSLGYDEDGDTKYSTYTLPGGENYTELLLTTPMRTDLVAPDIVERDGLFFVNARQYKTREAAESAQKGFTRPQPNDENYNSSHWDESNVLAHTRFKERTGPNGERVLALEEIQSDWHQAGRARGYRSDDLEVALKPKVEKAQKTLNAANAAYYEVLTNMPEALPAFPSEAEFVEWARENSPEMYKLFVAAKSADGEYKKLKADYDAAVHGSPNAPFKNNAWVNLVLKRMIRYATENGFDSVAWIPGNIQNGQEVDTGDDRADFYNKIVPNAANKLGKKYGAKTAIIGLGEPKYKVTLENGKVMTDNQPTREAAEFVSRSYDGAVIEEVRQPFWSLPLTPELKALAMDQGFPLFQSGANPKGWGETAPPTDLPPMRLNLSAVREAYGEDAVRKLPHAVRKRAASSNDVNDMLQNVKSVRDTLKAKPPTSLFKFIRSKKVGGIKEGNHSTGDVRSIMDDNYSLINNKSGRDLDYVREMAEEAGYISSKTDEYGRTSIQDLLDALAKEAGGEPVYSEQDAEQANNYENAQRWKEWFEDNGVDVFEDSKPTLRKQIEALITSTSDGAVDADRAAEVFGFSSGEAMLAAMAEIGSRGKHVNAEAKRRMAEEFGDPFNDGSLAEKARLYAENEVRVRQTEIELAALNEALGRNAASKRAKEMARERLSEMTVKQVSRYNTFRDNEQRWSRAALEAVEKGDMTNAMIYKQRQLVNMHLYREGEKLSQKLDKVQRELRKYETVKSRRAKIAPDYMERIDDLLSAYELRISKQGRKEQERRASVAAWVSEMIAEGREAEIAPEASLLAEAADLKTWQSLTVDEASYLKATIENLAHLGKRKAQLLSDRDKREFNAVIDELVETLEAAGPVGGKLTPLPSREQSHRPTAGERVSGALRKSHAWLMRPEHQFRALDGRDGGPLWNALFRGFSDAADMESSMSRDSAKSVRKAYNIYSSRERYVMHNVGIEIPELGKPIGQRWTKMDVISMALNWGVEYNRQALIEGYGWNAEQVEAALNRLMTNKDWDFVEAIWEESGRYKKEAFALEKAMTGVEPKAVEGVTFTLPSGRVIEGKYYHLEYDSRQIGKASNRQKVQDEREALSNRMRSTTKPQTRNGALKERVGSGGKPVKLNISVFERSVMETIHDIAYRKAVIDASRIVTNDRFREAYQRASGMEAYDQLMPWLETIATEKTDQIQGMASIFQTMRRNLPISYMGIKVGTAMIQWTGALAGIPEVGHRYFAQGVAKAFFANPLSVFGSWRAVSEKSEFMRDRPMGYDRDVREITSQMGAANPLGDMRRNAFILISGMDIAVSTPLWIAGYDKALAGKIDGIERGNEDDAIAYADSLIRRTQTAGRNQDLARVSRDTEFWKMFTMIFGYFSNLYAFTSQKVRAVRSGEVNPVEFAYFATILFVAIPLLAEMSAGRLFAEDDEDESLASKSGDAVISNFAGMFPVIRDMVNYKLKPEYGYNMSPVASGMEDAAQTFNALLETAIDGEEFTEADTKRAVRALGGILGIPASQLVITGDYLWDVMQGEEDPIEEPGRIFTEGLLRNTG